MVQIDPSKARRGARAVKGEIDRVGTAADRTRTLIARAFAFVGVGLAIRKLVQLTDAFTGMTNRLRTVITDQDVLNDTFNKLSGIATRTRTSLGSVIELYQRGSIAAKELGITNSELLTFVERVGQALAIQGGSAASASGALLQLSQSLGSGIVRAEEFNSILEGAFPIALAAAKGIDKAGGSVAKLRTFIIEGKITSEEFFRGFVKGSEDMKEVFERTTPTIGQALTVLGDQFTLFLGRANEASGVGEFFARSLLSIATNLDAVFDVVKRVGVVLLLLFAPQILAAAGALVTLVGRLVAGFLLMLGPVGLAVGLFAALVIAVDSMTGGIGEIEGQVVTLGDVLSGVFTVAVELFNDVAKILKSVLVPAFQSVSFEVKDLRGVFKFLLDGIVFTFDAIIGGAFALGKGIAVVINRFPELFKGVFILVGNTVKGLFIDLVNELIETANLLGANFDLIEFTPFGEEGAREAIDAVEELKAAVKEGFELQPLRSLVDRVGEASLAARDARLFTEELTEATEEDNASKAAAVILTKEQTSSLEALIDRLDPLGKLQRDLVEEQKLLNQALKAGAIDAARYAELLVLLNEQFDLAGGNLVKKYNLETQSQLDLLRDIRKPAEDYAKTVEDLNFLFARGAISQDEFNDRLRESRIGFLDTQRDIGSGFERAFLRLEESASNAADVAEEALTGAFKAAEDAVVEFAQTGKFEIGDFAREVSEQLLRLGTQQAIAGIGQGFGAGIGGGGSGGGGFNIGSALGSLFGFARGGSFSVSPQTAVGSLPGVDNRVVAFRARDREEVTVTPPGERAGGITLVQNISVKDEDSFRRSSSQNTNRAAAALTRARNRR